MRLPLTPAASASSIRLEEENAWRRSLPWLSAMRFHSVLMSLSGVLLGYTLGYTMLRSNTRSSRRRGMPTHTYYHWIKFVMISTFVFWCRVFANLLNTYMDEDVDRRQTRSATDRTIVDRICESWVVAELCMAALVLAIISGMTLCVYLYTAAPALPILLLSLLFLAYVYSGHPVPLKRLGGSEVLLFLAHFLLVITTAYTCNETFHSYPMYYGVVFGVLSTMPTIVNNALDRHVDNECEVQTLTALFDSDRVHESVMYIVFLMITLLGAYWRSWYIVLVPVPLSFTIIGYSLINITTNTVRRRLETRARTFVIVITTLLSIATYLSTIK